LVCAEHREECSTEFDLNVWFAGADGTADRYRCAEHADYCPDLEEEADPKTIVVECCQTLGAFGWACRPDGSCDAKMTCVDGNCLHAGGHREACFENGACDEGFECRDDGELCGVYDPNRYAEQCCVPLEGQGTAGGICRADRSCDEGLSCDDSHCL